MTLQINRHKIFRFATCCIVAFIALDLLVKVIGIRFPALRQSLHVLKVDHEDSIPNWFKSIELAVCAATLFVIYAHKRATGDRFRRHWAGLAAIFACMSAEEIAALHETITEPLHNALHTSGMLYFAWLIPAAAIVLVIGLSYLRFVIAFPGHLRTALILSAAVYLGAAMGLESLAGMWVTGHGMNNVVFALETAAEEGCQMLGALLFLRVLLHHAADCGIELKMQFASQRSERMDAPMSYLLNSQPPAARAA